MEEIVEKYDSKKISYSDIIKRGLKKKEELEVLVGKVKELEKEAGEQIESAK